MPTVADLHLAIAQRNVVALERIIDSKFDINKKQRGATALSLTIYRGYADLAAILVQADADVNLNSIDYLGRVEPPLCSACRLGHLNIVRVLLSSPKIDINQRDFFNKSPLWIATKERRFDIFELLLKNDASVNVAETWSECPLYLATKYPGRQQFAEVLIISGCRLNISDPEGRTPLYWTCHHADFKICTLLLHAGAKLTNEALNDHILPPSWKENYGLCKWIKEMFFSPSSLKSISRNFIRRWLALRWNILCREKINTLPIPSELKGCLMLDDVEN